jgi:hypothetical protein
VLFLVGIEFGIGIHVLEQDSDYQKESCHISASFQVKATGKQKGRCFFKSSNSGKLSSVKSYSLSSFPRFG